MSMFGSTKKVSAMVSVTETVYDGLSEDFDETLNVVSLRFIDPNVECSYLSWALKNLRSSIRKVLIFLPIAAVVLVVVHGFLVLDNESKSDQGIEMGLRIGGISTSCAAVLLVMNRGVYEIWFNEIHLAFYVYVILTVIIIPAALTDGLTELGLGMSIPFIMASLPTLTRLPYLHTIALVAFVVVSYAVAVAVVDVESASSAVAIALFFVAFGIVYIHAAKLSEIQFRKSFVRWFRLQLNSLKMEEQLAVARGVYDRNASQIDFQSPLDKAIANLRGLLIRPHVPAADVEALTFVLKVLSLNPEASYTPNFLGDASMDKETEEFLQSELRIRTKGPDVVLQNNGVEDSSSEVSASFNGMVQTTALTPRDESALNECLSNTQSWEFDPFELHTASGGQPIRVLGDYLMRKNHLYSHFHIDRQSFKSFLSSVEASYLNMPYHNAVHAADVLHSTFYLFSRPQIAGWISKLDLLACIVAAVIHDVQHPGTSNQFLIATNSDLAITYNDHSVLENHHLATGFRLLEKSRALANLDQKKYRSLRSLIIELVLATDISHHFNILSAFRARMAASNVFMLETVSGLSGEDHNLLLKILFKAGDIGVCSKSVPLFKKWTQCLMEEFYTQGDKERELGMPVSAFMDRNRPDVAKCQLGFINYICAPLFESFAEPLLGRQSFQENIAKSKAFLEDLDAVTSEPRYVSLDLSAEDIIMRRDSSVEQLDTARGSGIETGRVSSSDLG